MQVLRKLGHLEPSLQDLNQALALLVTPNSMRAFALEQRGSVRGSLKDFRVRSNPSDQWPLDSAALQIWLLFLVLESHHT